MKYMKKIVILFGVLCFLSGSIALASDYGIGIGFPIPTGSQAADMPKESYAAFSLPPLAYELTVNEKHSRLIIELKVTNKGAAPYTIEHNTGQEFDIIISGKEHEELYRWSDGMAFTQAFSVSTIAAGETAVHRVELDSKDYRKIKNDAVLVTAFLTDTEQSISAKLPTRYASRTPITIFGGIGHHW